MEKQEAIANLKKQLPGPGKYRKIVEQSKGLLSLYHVTNFFNNKSVSAEKEYLIISTAKRVIQSDKLKKKKAIQKMSC